MLRERTFSVKTYQISMNDAIKYVIKTLTYEYILQNIDITCINHASYKGNSNNNVYFFRGVIYFFPKFLYKI